MAHCPIAVVSVDAAVAEDGKSAVARVCGLDADDSRKRLREIEADCIRRLCPGTGTGTEAEAGVIWLKAALDAVECVRGATTARVPFATLHGVKCRLQLIARPINAWSYTDADERVRSGLAWEVDRAFVAASPLEIVGVRA